MKFENNKFDYQWYNQFIYNILYLAYEGIIAKKSLTVQWVLFDNSSGCLNKFNHKHV